MENYNKLLYVFKNAIIEPNTQFLGKGRYLFKISKTGIIYHYRKIANGRKSHNHNNSYKHKYQFIGISYNNWFIDEGFDNSYQWLKFLILYTKHNTYVTNINSKI